MHTLLVHSEIIQWEIEKKEYQLTNNNMKICKVGKTDWNTQILSKNTISCDVTYFQAKIISLSAKAVGFV